MSSFNKRRQREQICYAACAMDSGKPFCVVQLDSLEWPVNLQIPSRRFRLFVAADLAHAFTEALSTFAHSALKNGTVCFCVWEPDCKRLHDIVDEIVVDDEVGQHLFVGENRSDTIMTTWHDDGSLADALDFFVNFTCPTAGFERNSNFLLAVCVGNSEWATAVQRRLEETNLPIGDWPPSVR